MLFIILFCLSIVGILFLYKIEKRKNKIGLLHYIKKSCNIDSVQFERGFKKQRNIIYKKIVSLEKPFLNFLKNIHLVHSHVITHSKKRIRKKLFHNQKNIPTPSKSQFISEIKKYLE